MATASNRPSGGVIYKPTQYYKQSTSSKLAPTSAPMPKTSNVLAARAPKSASAPQSFLPGQHQRETATTTAPAAPATPKFDGPDFTKFAKQSGMNNATNWKGLITEFTSSAGGKISTGENGHLANGQWFYEQGKKFHETDFNGQTLQNKYWDMQSKAFAAPKEAGLQGRAYLDMQSAELKKASAYKANYENAARSTYKDMIAEKTAQIVKAAQDRGDKDFRYSDKENVKARLEDLTANALYEKDTGNSSLVDNLSDYLDYTYDPNNLKSQYYKSSEYTEAKKADDARIKAETDAYNAAHPKDTSAPLNPLAAWGSLWSTPSTSNPSPTTSTSKPASTTGSTSSALNATTPSTSTPAAPKPSSGGGGGGLLGGLFDGIIGGLGGAIIDPIASVVNKPIQDLVTKPIENLAGKINDKIAKPITNAIGDNVVKPIENVASTVNDKIAKPITNAVGDNVVKPIENVASTVNDKIVKPVTDPVLNVAGKLNDKIVKPVTEGIGNVGSQINDKIVKPITNEIGKIPSTANDLITDVAGTAGDLIEDGLSQINEKIAKPVTNTLGDAVSTVGNIAEKIVKPITDVGNAIGGALGGGKILDTALDSLANGNVPGTNNKPTTPTPPPTPADPKVDDAGTTQQKAVTTGGKTSTMLAGLGGFEEDDAKLSKILLGR